MAAGAPDGEPEKRLRCGRNHVVDHFQPQPVWVGLLIEPGADREKCRGGDLVHLLATICAGREQIAGELLGYELVVWLIVVERTNDIVAIRLVAAGVRNAGEIDPSGNIAGNIEPMTSPFFAIVWRGEKPIDQFLVGIRRSVGKKCPDLFWPRRQPQQIECRSSYQYALIGLGSGSQPFRFKSSEDELIDRIANPIGFLNCRRRRTFDRLERPKS